MSRVLFLIVVLVAFSIPANSVPPARAAAALSFSFANGTLAEDEALVRNGVKFAEEFFGAEFGISIDAPVTIDVRGTQQYDVIAYTGPGSISIATGALGWHYSPALRKLQTVIHEYVHLIHWQSDPDGTMPLWLAEGSSEYLAWYAIGRLGLLDLDVARDFWIGSVLTNPLLSGVPLSALEEPSQAGASSVYEIGAYAVSQLVAQAGVAALFDYFTLQAGEDRAQAFERAFGLSFGAFYANFEANRAAAYPAGYDVTRLTFPWYPATDPADVSGATAWPVVQPGGFSLVQARTAPGTTCSLTFIDPNDQPILEQQMRANSDGSIFWLWQLEDLTVTGRAQASISCGLNSEQVPIDIG